MKEIDFALVEEKRPPIYTSMKYWGKKPHNIWRTYIETYTLDNEKVLDPFSGSAIAAFEAVKCGKKAIAFDLNPLTSFIIEVYSTEFKKEIFIDAVNEIINKIEKDETYNRFFSYNCEKCNGFLARIQHFKWDNGKIYELGIDCPRCKKRYLVKPNVEQEKLAKEIENIIIPYWYPHDKFYNSPSFSPAFIKNIGDDSFSALWTKRNLFVLSFIFNEIQKISNDDLKKQLLFGFIQSLHLSSKMCVPRREGSKREFSTSWGRSAYICAKRQMEMNPLLLFKSSCLGKQSVKSTLENVVKYLGKVPCSVCVNNHPDEKAINNCDILYGVVDINEIDKYVKQESIGFIITDPPYGGLVQYLDLSQIWLVWLKHYNKKYTPDIDSEITIKHCIQEIDEYSERFTKGIKNLYYLLKNDGKIVFTFHNQDLKVWNAFLRSLSKAGFKVEKVIHQQNRRTGESNVANPYGTSASDFYIRCSKSNYIKNIKTTKEQFENFIIDRAVKIIMARNEPTPYQILFNGLLSELSKAGFELENFDENIQQILKKHISDVFIIEESDKAYGNLWWLKDHNQKAEYIIPLSERVKETVLSLFKKRKELTIDEVLAEIFINYPNGLTPDIKKISEYIKKYAHKSGDKWVYNGLEEN